jgi:mRNA-degrading endonuclease YafQ of YafQ-DinJ toxin-antitoxin module
MRLDLREIIKKWIKQNPSKAKLLKEVIELFILNPFHPLLKTHKLKGKLKECYAFTVEYDRRIIFYFEDESHAVLIALGSHDEVY